MASCLVYIGFFVKKTGSHRKTNIYKENRKPFLQEAIRWLPAAIRWLPENRKPSASCAACIWDVSKFIVREKKASLEMRVVINGRKKVNKSK